MGNRLKSAKNTTDTDVFIEEKEEELEVKSLAKDERTHKIIGSVLVFICLFLFVAFTSYLFTWNENRLYDFRT